MAKLKVQILGGGLFLIGESLISTRKIVSVDLTEIQNNHRVTYEFNEYYVRISWIEDTAGKRSNPQWERIIK